MIAADAQHGFYYPWLFARRGIVYDALHVFVSADGYRLADRIWRTDQRTRNAIDELLAERIRGGTSAVELAKELEQYLRPERAGVRTKAPYGRWASYDAMRLARTEITAAAGRAEMAAAMANPFVSGERWALSGSHPDGIDCNCEANSEHDEGLGRGVYPKGRLPRYPDHPHCLCNIQPVVADSPEVVADRLRAWLNEEVPEDGPGTVGFWEMVNLVGLLERLMAKWV